jgi:hypothetical protein
LKFRWIPFAASQADDMSASLVCIKSPTIRKETSAKSDPIILLLNHHSGQVARWLSRSRSTFVHGSSTWQWKRMHDKVEAQILEGEVDYAPDTELPVGLEPRVSVEAGGLHVDIGLRTVVALPAEETERAGSRPPCSGRSSAPPSTVSRAMPSRRGIARITSTSPTLPARREPRRRSP